MFVYNCFYFQETRDRKNLICYSYGGAFVECSLPHPSEVEIVQLIFRINEVKETTTMFEQIFHMTICSFFFRVHWLVPVETTAFIFGVWDRKNQSLLILCDLQKKGQWFVLMLKTIVLLIELVKIVDFDDEFSYFCLLISHEIPVPLNILSSFIHASGRLIGNCVSFFFLSSASRHDSIMNVELCFVVDQGDNHRSDDKRRENDSN